MKRKSDISRLGWCRFFYFRERAYTNSISFEIPRGIKYPALRHLGLVGGGLGGGGDVQY